MFYLNNANYQTDQSYYVQLHTVHIMCIILPMTASFCRLMTCLVNNFSKCTSFNVKFTVGKPFTIIPIIFNYYTNCFHNTLKISNAVVSGVPSCDVRSTAYNCNTSVSAYGGFEYPIFKDPVPLTPTMPAGAESVPPLKMVFVGATLLSDMNYRLYLSILYLKR